MHCLNVTLCTRHPPDSSVCECVLVIGCREQPAVWKQPQGKEMQMRIHHTCWKQRIETVENICLRLEFCPGSAGVSNVTSSPFKRLKVPVKIVLPPSTYTMFSANQQTQSEAFCYERATGTEINQSGFLRDWSLVFLCD